MNEDRAVLIPRTGNQRTFQKPPSPDRGEGFVSK
jgi:hypothetical protein